MAKSNQFTILGKPTPRIDATSKATGRALYLDDLTFPGLLHAWPKPSNHPHARIRSIETTRAERMPGVKAIMTSRDIPGENQVGVIVFDQPLLAERKVRYVGDCVAVVAAETREQAEQAARLTEVSYEELPAVFDPRASLAPDAVRVHDQGNLVIRFKIRKGNTREAFSRCAVSAGGVFRTGPQEHMYLEPQAAIAVPGPDGDFVIYGSLQCPFYVQKAVARVLGIPLSRVRVIQTVTGGGFGGKEDVPSEICARAALLAWATGRPVKLVLGRRLDVLTSSKRHPMLMEYRLGATREGKILVAEVDIYADAGAYATLSTLVPWRSTVHAIGPYDIPNVRVDTHVVYTNNHPSGAFRGFGGPQVAFGSEGVIEELALRLGIDPLKLRLKNALRMGSATATGHVLTESVGLEQTLRRARDTSRWTSKRNSFRADRGRYRRGIGAAAIHYGVSLGARGWALDGSGAFVQIHQDGSVSVSIGGTEMGQGAFTVLSQIAAEGLGIPLSSINMLPVDTQMVPDSGPSVASRVTVMSGNAILDAVRKLKADVLRVAAGLMHSSPDRITIRDGVVQAGGKTGKSLSFAELVRECFRKNVNLAQEGWTVAPKVSWDDETGQGKAYYVYSFATQIAEVEVDTWTGRVKVKNVLAVHDVGRALNPQGIEGQVEGGVMQGMGFALTEDFRTMQGRVLTPDFSTYLLPTSMDAPDVRTMIVEEPSPDGPFGAKGVGEPALIPAAAAIANAVSHAIGVRMKDLPMTPEAILVAMAAPVRQHPPPGSVRATCIKKVSARRI